jgi:hypothetical protein
MGKEYRSAYLKQQAPISALWFTRVEGRFKNILRCARRGKADHQIGQSEQRMIVIVEDPAATLFLAAQLLQSAVTPRSVSSQASRY